MAAPRTMPAVSFGCTRRRLGSRYGSRHLPANHRHRGNNEGEDYEIDTWSSSRHDPPRTIRRHGLMPAGEHANFERITFEHGYLERAKFARSSSNKPCQFQSDDNCALSDWSPPKRFDFNCHRMRFHRL